jgi:hypothetical protein
MDATEASSQRQPEHTTGVPAAHRCPHQGSESAQLELEINQRKSNWPTVIAMRAPQIAK